MRLLHKLDYKKKKPFRDASILIIVCEGRRREPDYFNYFDQIDSRLKIIVIPSKNGASAPNHLLQNAQDAIETHIKDSGSYKLWLVLDTDRWKPNQIQSIIKACDDHESWKFALSNPCFEVWLYFHERNRKPDPLPDKCADWKRLVNEIFQGGFNSNYHPGLFSNAINNAKRNYTNQGYIPDCGSTQVFSLGEEIHKIVQNKGFSASL